MPSPELSGTGLVAGDAVELGAGRALNRASGLLAAAVLADSAVEHYRGSFQNRAMFGALAAAALSLAVSLHGTADRRARSHRARDGVYGLAAATGIVGTGFHLYNLASRPGGVSWHNLFYAAPIGAPAALSLSGMLGLAAERVRDMHRGPARRWGPRALAGAIGLGILGTTMEATLLHFRGAFQNPAMAIPVALPPVSAVLLGHAALRPSRRRHRAAATALGLTAAAGVAGVGFHAWGVARMMGGWRNWRQNAVDGPPLPAPPAFSALALGGLAVLRLMEDR